MTNVLTIDVEDWFHILDSSAVPGVKRWDSLESRVEGNVERLLEMLEGAGVRATLFWLGWVAERHKDLVRRCQQAGHEVASHGYGHVLAYQVGRKGFREDVVRAKSILEDITGRSVPGFRAAGFGITDEAPWAFEVIREAGHVYDASVFPAARGHGGMADAPLAPHVVDTPAGPLPEVPASVVEVRGRRVCLFGGGYLRLAPQSIIEWGIHQLESAGRPLIVYVHPREIDPDHPRLPLGLKRRFKCYVNLHTTMPKLEWLCREFSFCTMGELVERLGLMSSGRVGEGSSPLRRLRILRRTGIRRRMGLGRKKGGRSRGHGEEIAEHEAREERV